MKLIMHKQDYLQQDRVELYYNQLNHTVQAIIDLVQGESFHIQGSFEGEKYMLDPNAIYYFECVDKISFAYLKEKVYQVSYTLIDLEKKLEEYGFIRIGKSVIVNIYKIEYMKSDLNMRIKAHLQNGEELIINRHYKKAFENKLNTLKKQLEGASLNEEK